MVQDILSLAKIIPRVLLLSVLLATTYLFVKENGSKKIKEKLMGILRESWLTAFIIYLAFILTGTIFVRQVVSPYNKIFDSFGFRGDPIWDKEIIENILLFVPYTFFYLQAFQSGNCWSAALKLSIGTSVIIELTQLLFWLGNFQFADILHNVIGGIGGCLMWILVKWVIRKYK